VHESSRETLSNDEKPKEGKKKWTQFTNKTANKEQRDMKPSEQKGWIGR